jgi:hypothetical protein
MEPGVFRLRVKLRRTAVTLVKAVRPGVDYPPAIPCMTLTSAPSGTGALP